ncbi:hypothetical protein N9Q43_00650 [bacterium]|nr:hypothetical protein [bacterium]
MGLVDLTTNLKSLRYGKDTVGGGNSNQPYVTTKIPESFSKVGKTGGPDFLLRGGILLPKIVVNDVSRLKQMFFDFKSPNGPLFIAKQNVLSLTNVSSQEGYVVAKDSAIPPGNTGSVIGNLIRSLVPPLNQGIYTPLSTIGQAAGNAIGLHLNKQGFGFNFKTTKGSQDGNSLLGLPTYLNTISTGGDDGNKSRLYGLLDKIDEKQDDPNALYSYSGGPGATLGVGKTNIVMVGDQRTGINNPTLKLQDSRFVPKQFVSNGSIKPNTVFKNSIISIWGKAIDSLSPKSSFSTALDFAFSNPSVYQPGTYLKTDTGKLVSGVYNTPRQVWTQAEIEGYTPFSKKGNPNDIKNFTKVIAPNGSQFIPNSLSYTQDNKIENRVNLGDPGKRANRRSYTIGRQEEGENWSVSQNSSYRHALDKINALPIYQSSSPTTNNIKNDLVKFRIGVISNSNPNLKTYIHFRAFIDSMSDNFTAEWGSQKYMGRGEKFYKYQGFDRNLSLSWTVAAQSKQELIPMYQKLNYLASVTAPSYSETGYMGGNLISLTIGGYLYEQVGIMTSLTLDVPTESPWEIGIPDGSNPGEAQDGSGIKSDASVKELPMIIRVTGFNFIPIHNFVPKVQGNEFTFGEGDDARATQKLEGGGTFVGEYGKEQYIGLATTGGQNNYSGGKNNPNLNYIPGRERVGPVSKLEPIGIQPINTFNKTPDLIF